MQGLSQATCLTLHQLPSPAASMATSTTRRAAVLPCIAPNGSSGHPSVSRGKTVRWPAAQPPTAEQHLPMAAAPPGCT